MDTLQYYLSKGRLPQDRTITMRDLLQSGAVSHIKDGVVLLGRGSEHYTIPCTIEVTRASQRSIQTIEKVGGKITTVYHNRIALQALLYPEKWAIEPQSAFPTKYKDIGKFWIYFILYYILWII